MGHDIREMARQASMLSAEGMDLLSAIGGTSIVVGAPHRQGERFRSLLAWIGGCPEPVDLASLDDLRHQAVDGVLPPPDGPDLTPSQLEWLSVPVHDRAYREALALDVDETIPASLVCHDVMRRQLLQDLSQIAEGIGFRLDAEVEPEFSPAP